MKKRGDPYEGCVSKGEFARIRGCAPSMVTKLLKEGKLVMIGRRVHVAKSLERIAAVIDPACGGRRSGNSSGISRDLSATDSYTHVRTEREAFRAKSEEVEYWERVGQLVEKARYDKALADSLPPILSTLDSLSARIGPAIAAESDVRKVQNIMDDAITTIRQEMADTLRQMVPGAKGVLQ